MVLRYLLRASLPTLWGHTVPAALVTLFVVSQLSAMVDFVEVARLVGLRPWWQRGLMRLMLVLLTAISLPPTLWAIWQEVGRWFRSLPLAPSALAGAWLVPGTIGALPVAIIAGLDGGGSLLTVAFGGTVLAFAGLARRWGLGVGVVVASLLGAWVALPLYLLLLPATGRAIRRIEPRSPGSRSSWMGRGPLSALWMRDLTILVRHEGRILWATAIFSVLSMAFVLRNMHLHWSVWHVDVAALSMLAAWGWVPAWALSRLAEHAHASVWDRSVPVHPLLRAGILAATILTPLLPLILTASAWMSSVGLLRLVAILWFLASWAVWNAAERDRSKRVQGTGSGVAVAVFSTLFAALMGPGAAWLFMAAACACVWFGGRR